MALSTGSLTFTQHPCILLGSMQKQRLKKSAGTSYAKYDDSKDARREKQYKLVIAPWYVRRLLGQLPASEAELRRLPRYAGIAIRDVVKELQAAGAWRCERGDWHKPPRPKGS